MEIEIIYTCPLGSQCEEVKDDKLHRCRWFQELQGKNPQSEELLNERRCALEWMNILQIEHSLFERQTGAAIESFRNTMLDSNNNLIQGLLSAAKEKKLKNGN